MPPIVVSPLVRLALGALGTGIIVRTLVGAPRPRELEKVADDRIEPLDLARLAGRFRPQTMIDRDCNKLRAARQGTTPARHQPHQGDRIGAAGDRQHQRRGLSPVGKQVLGILSRDRGIVVL